MRALSSRYRRHADDNDTRPCPLVAKQVAIALCAGALACLYVYFASVLAEGAAGSGDVIRSVTCTAAAYARSRGFGILWCGATAPLVVAHLLFPVHALAAGVAHACLGIWGLQIVAPCAGSGDSSTAVGTAASAACCLSVLLSLGGLLHGGLALRNRVVRLQFRNRTTTKPTDGDPNTARRRLLP